MRRESAGADLLISRQTLRRRALANLLLMLLDAARATAGRLAVQPLAQDAVLLAFRDVRTLVHYGGSFRLERRDFAVALACPALWPFERAAAIVPTVLTPDDFAHPNSDGHGLCVDCAGVWPQDVPALLYDNVRLLRFRLDHCVDWRAADFVRAHLQDFPADPRPLYPDEGAS
jgi:hypothetical protein